MTRDYIMKFIKNCCGVCAAGVMHENFHFSPLLRDGKDPISPAGSLNLRDEKVTFSP